MLGGGCFKIVFGTRFTGIMNSACFYRSHLTTRNLTNCTTSWHIQDHQPYMKEKGYKYDPAVSRNSIEVHGKEERARAFYNNLSLEDRCIIAFSGTNPQDFRHGLRLKGEFGPFSFVKKNGRPLCMFDEFAFQISIDIRGKGVKAPEDIKIIKSI